MRYIHFGATATLCAVALFSAYVGAGPLSSPAGGQTQAPARQLEAVVELTQPDEMTNALRGARSAKVGEWKASLYPDGEAGTCTSTLVASEVLLTAAHCVGPGGVAFTLAGKSYHGDCEQADAYKTDASADYALCKVSPAVTGIKFERVDNQAGAVSVGQEVLLTGFGCTSSDGTGGNDFVYRIGESDVSQVPTGAGNTIVTSGKAAICFGDSGGAAFLMGPGPTRRIIGVNSKVVGEGTGLGDESRLASTGSNAARKFFADWAAGHGSPKICGIDGDAKSCRV